MIWDFFRKTIKFVGTRIVGKRAPRLHLAQYSHLANKQIKTKGRRNRIHQMRSQSQMLINKILTKNIKQSIGLSSIKEEVIEQPYEANILSVYAGSQLLGLETMVSEIDNSQEIIFEMTQHGQSAGGLISLIAQDKINIALKAKELNSDFKSSIIFAGLKHFFDKCCPQKSYSTSSFFRFNKLFLSIQKRISEIYVSRLKRFC